MLNILIAQAAMLTDVTQSYVKTHPSEKKKKERHEMKISEARRRKLPTPPILESAPFNEEEKNGLTNQALIQMENKHEYLFCKGSNRVKATDVVGTNKAESSITDKSVCKLGSAECEVEKPSKMSLMDSVKDKSKNVLNEGNAYGLQNKMCTPEKNNLSTSYYSREKECSSINGIRRSNHCSIVRKIEIKKIPGQSLGFFIRKGNGFDRKDGIFISRVSLGSVLDEMGLLHAGDEVLEVNQVKTEGFSLENVALMMQIPERLILTTATTASMHGKSIPNDNKSAIKHKEPKEKDLTIINSPSDNFLQNTESSTKTKHLKNDRSNPVVLPSEIALLRNHDRLTKRRRSHSDGNQVELANALDLLLLKGVNDSQTVNISTEPTQEHTKLTISQSTPARSYQNNPSKPSRTIPKSPKFLRKLAFPSGLKQAKSKDSLTSNSDHSLLREKKNKKTLENWHSHTLDRNSKFKTAHNDFSPENDNEKRQNPLSDPRTKENYKAKSFPKRDFLFFHQKSSSKDNLCNDHDPAHATNGYGFTRAQKYIRKARSSQSLSGSEEAIEMESTKKSPKVRRSSVNTPPYIKSPLSKKISVPSLMQPFNTLRRKKSEHKSSLTTTDINFNDTTDSGSLSSNATGSANTSSLDTKQEFSEYDSVRQDADFKCTRGFSGMLSVHILKITSIPINDDMKNLYCNIDIDDKFQAITSRKLINSSVDFDESFEIEMSQACEMTIYLFAETRCSGPEDLISSCIIHLEKVLQSKPYHKLKVSMERSVILYLRLDFTEAVNLLKRTPSRLHRGVFGFNLVATLAEEENTIPLIVRKCVEEIELRGLQNKGIYRICGNARKKRLLKAEFDANSASVDVSVESGIDCNILSGILKDYLRELPEPLISEAMYSSLIDSKLRTQSPDLNTRQELLSGLINLIPYSNRGTLIYIMDHLVKVADHKETNKMDIANLAVCFGPVLLCTSSFHSVPQGILDFKGQKAALEYLLHIWPKLHERGEEVEITII